MDLVSAELSWLDDLAADTALAWWLGDRDATRDEVAREEAEQGQRRVEGLEREVAALNLRIAELEGRSR